MGDSMPLRDIHAAMPAQWWPFAPLVWVLLGVALVGLIVVLVASWRRWRRRRRRQVLVDDLNRLQTHFTSHQDRPRLARELSEWMRRLLLYRSGMLHKGVAGLSGKAWRDILLAPFVDNARLSTAAAQLCEAPWQASGAFDEAAAFDLAIAWVDRLTEQGNV